MKKKYIYEISICILAIISVVFAVIDITKGLESIQKNIDTVIYIIFVIDYFVRLILANSKKEFIKLNIFDLIAIIPFNSAFRMFRVLKFTKLLKLTKLFRLGSVSIRLLTKAKRFLNTNGLKYVIILVILSIAISSLIITKVEHMPLPDAIWWAFVTATTVGYGDLSPTTPLGRIIAALLMLVGIGLIGSLTSSITSFFLNEKEEPTYNNDKVDMVLALYSRLTDEEKESFKNNIK